MQPEDPIQEWWRIDPRSGEPLEPGGANAGDTECYLGDAPLADAGMVGVYIDSTFGSARHFNDEEARRLLRDRVVPKSVRPHDDAATDLLESLDDLWKLVDERYHAKWGRPANDVERRFIAERVFITMQRK